MSTEDRAPSPGGSVPEEDVTAALAGVLASRPFRNSNQCSSLLRYIVQHTLAGEENLLRERVIGAELFGRPADYETSEDPVVRLRVSEVRKRLAQYYLTERDPRGIHIEIPSGSYRAQFRWSGVGEISSATASSTAGSATALATVEPPASEVRLVRAPDTELVPSSETPSRYAFGVSSKAIFIAGTLVILLLALCSVAMMRGNAADRAYRAFWNPWVSGQKPVLISIGSNAVYRFQYEYLKHYAEQHGESGRGLEIYVPLDKNQTLSASDLYPAYKSFVALGDVAAVSRVVATLTAQKKQYEERFPEDVSFAELRESPSVLVGGFNNDMTLELIKELPFTMRGGNEIVDTQDTKRKWQLNVPVPEPADYAIVTRIVQREGDAPVISIAGLGQYGTLAAAELICTPASVQRVTRELPKDWPEKNMQIVIRVKIVDFKASASEVVAVKSW